MDGKDKRNPYEKRPMHVKKDIVHNKRPIKETHMKRDMEKRY